MTGPLYIPRSGEQVFPPPYTAKGVQLYGFLARASADAIKVNLCDRYFNGPMGGGDRFCPAGDHLLFVFNTIDQLRSETPPFDQRGWFPEQEAAVWTLIADRVRRRLFWFHPYMLVDNSYAMAMGREIYGFPKEIGWFQIPRGGAAPDTLSVETLAVKTFGPDAAGQRLPLFSVRRGDSGGAHKVFSGLEGLVSEVAQIAGIGHGLMERLELGAHVLEDVTRRLMPMLFFKQFRDGTEPQTACFQSIQEVASQLVTLHGAKIFSERYSVEINDLASHPVRADLGLPAGPVDVKAAFWLNFDFRIGSCTEVWRSGHAEAASAPAATPAAPAAAPQPAGPPFRGTEATGDPAPAPGAPGPTPPAGRKKRIAILGGGAAAMAAAWRITSEPDWQQHYEVTVYQMGWRLGGKGASGRRPPTGRIEEHGLHIWLGFYHNAFRALQAAHREINPGVSESVPAGNSPPRILNGVFARCEDAFQRHSTVGVDMDFAPGRCDPWMMQLPESAQKPWLRESMPSADEYLELIGQFLAGTATIDVGQEPQAAVHQLYQAEESAVHGEAHGWLSEHARHLVVDLEEIGLSAGMMLRKALGRHLSDAAADLARPDAGGHGLLDGLLDGLITRMQGWLAHEMRRDKERDPHAMRHMLMVDMAATVARGLVIDRALDEGGFRALDGEFRSWLQHHGALPETTSLVTNPLLRGLYDFVFAFDGGNSHELDKSANFATAPALRTLLRMCFTYDGAIFWKMRAGMGDTIFTPFYKALKQRGVDFRFFHRVEQLHLSADRSAIERISITQQASVKGGKAYDPLVNWKGLDCWPSEADYGQLNEGAALKEAVAAQGVDLESMWFDWPHGKPVELQRETHFDEVVFAIPLGSVPFVAGELVAANDDWKKMVAQVKTVRTMGLQLWLKPTLEGLGWNGPAPVLDAYMEPFDTWADMSHLLPREDWSGQPEVPANVAYFCGAMPGGDIAQELKDPRTPLRARASVWVAAEAVLLQNIGSLWPKAVAAGGGLELDQSLILDHYQRANIDPGELYVMSVAGSSGARIKANATGFTNLFIAGDWIDNGFNAGCVEAAVMSGLQAANAVLGRDLNDDIHGRELC